MEEHDVFISYAHLDNRPFRPNEIESGWVSRFDYVLSNLLSTELGRPARIWRDKTMDSNDYIWGTIEENMMKSLAFILIISPSYLNSKWCPEEVRTFIKKRPVRVGNKSLIFKVVKQPFEPTKVPEDLKSLFEDVLATDFFEPDQNSGKARVFNAEFGEKWEQIFYQKVDFLAQEIAELVEKAKSGQVQKPEDEKKTEEASTLKPFLGMTIYMSEPSPDLWKDYLEIRRDFIKRGATVLPSVDSLKPEKIEDYETAILADLKQSKLIVHFVGSEDDQYSDENDRSLVEMQMNIAAKYQAEANCPRLIWLPQNVEPGSERHRQFVAQLAEIASRDVDLLRTSFELKNEMERILIGKPEPQAAPASQPAETINRKIYVLCDNQDAGAVNGLVDKLFQGGCEVWTVSQSGEAAGADLIEEHKYYLTNCDAALVYWNKAPTFRVRAMMSELQRIMDNGRDRDFLAKGVFIDGESPDKANFRTHETLVRNESDLAVFLARLKNGGQDQ
jgi:hypothetical protein